MKFSRNWLNEYVKIDDISIEELTNKLILSGFEVENVINEGEKLINIVVAKITKIEKHKNADTLQVCQTSIGDKELQIITRATNVFEGAFVPLALEGAILPDGLEIKATKMRGEDSFGMFCGREEIGLESDGIDGIYILDKEYELGTPIAQILGLDDVILDVSILSNRPDCNGVYEFAKEIGAIFNREVKDLELDFNSNQKLSEDEIRIEIQSSNCLNYLGHIVDNIQNVQSPAWMQRRLEIVGIRPINAIVDITNYVLTEIGQPMHAFDFSKIGGGNIIIRQANQGEKIVALNEVEYELNSNVLVIADNSKPLALAGVMGGLDSGINDQTTKILFESASFARGNIRSTVRSFGLSSDSSLRFERGVVPAFNEIGLKRALNLISKLGIGEVYSCGIVAKNYEEKENIVFASAGEINNRLGISLNLNQIFEILSRLGIKCEVLNLDEFKCVIPNTRNDIGSVQDLAEEVIRLYGINNIPSKLMNNVQYSIIEENSQYQTTKRIKDLLVDIGANEVVCVPLENVNKANALLADTSNAIKVANALSADFEVLRLSAVSSMLDVIKNNNNRSNKNLKLFEVGKEYSVQDGNYVEENVLTMAITGKSPNFFELKSWIELIANVLKVEFSYEVENSIPFLNKYKAAKVLLEGKTIGYIGELHPKVVKDYDLLEKVIVANIKLDSLFNLNKDIEPCKLYSKYQPIVRDFTFLVPNTMEYALLYDEIKKSSGKSCVNVTLKDIYAGDNIQEGYKSFTFELTYEKLEGTFTDEEMQNNVTRLLRALKHKLGISLKDEV